ncbi:MAG: hypothetical protein ACFFB5_02805 [Promethearchaeota archaeon]
MRFNQICYYKTRIFGCILILTILLSFSNNIIENPVRKSYSKEKSILQEYFDEEHISNDTYNYLSETWNPKNFSLHLPSDDLTNITDAFKSSYFEDWVNSAVYPSSNGKWIGNNEVYRQSGSNYEFCKKTYEDGREIIEETRFTGKPRVELVEAELSETNDIIVPIRSKTEDFVPSVYTRSETVNIGLNFELPGFRKEIIISLGLIRFYAYAIFNVKFHFSFPINVTIEHPKEVIKGAQYDLKCTVDPINLSGYDEFQCTIQIGFGFEVQINIPVLRWKRKTVKIFGIKFRITVPELDWKWVGIYGQGVGVDINEHESYKTPLSGETVTMSLPGKINLLNISKNIIMKEMAKFLRAGIGLGSLTVKGDKVQGKLTASTGDTEFTKETAWTSTGETKSMKFRVPDTEELFLKLVVSKLKYHASKVILTPTFFIGLKNLEFKGFKLPLEDIFGEFEIDLLPLSLGSINIPTQFSYSTSDFSYTSSDAYDFNMSITNIFPDQGQGTLTTLNEYDQIYEIRLQNGGRSDTVELEISGLPKGYSAFFLRRNPRYEIGSTPTNATLIVQAPKYFEVPPGDQNFTITATSNAKTYLDLPNPSTTEEVTVTVPEYTDMFFNLDHNLSEVILVQDGDFIPINYFGSNAGNMNDTFFINATLYTDTINKTWDSVYILDPYASGSGQYFNGQYGFNFLLGDVFPSPGIYSLHIQARSLRDPTIIQKYVLFLNFTTVYDLKSSITPIEETLHANYAYNFTMILNNTGNARDNFTLVSEGWDGYLTFPDRVTHLESLDYEIITVTLSIPDPSIVDPREYMFRIKAISEESGGTEVFHVGDVTLTILDPDETPPSVQYVRPFYSSDELIYPYSPLSLGPSWVAFDDFHDSYEIYINESLKFSDKWYKGVPIQVPVTGSNSLITAEGFYNVTITFNDTTGKISGVQAWVTITTPDTSDPTLTPLIDTLNLPRNYVQQQLITWNCSEEYLLNASIFHNGTKIPLKEYFIEQEIDESETFRTKCIIEPEKLGVGVHNFTLFVQDMGSNSASSTIIVNVSPDDLSSPVLHQGFQSSAIHSQGEFISINSSDAFPDRYELWLDSDIIQEGSWASNELIQFNVDDLNLKIGENNISIIVYDLSNHSLETNTILTLYDLDIPNIIRMAKDSSLYEHNISQLQAPFWEIQDNDPQPGYFEIYQDGEIVDKGSWLQGNNTIDVPILGLSPGTYTFTGFFFDFSGNFAESSVDVTINDILSPYIWPIEAIQYEPLYTADWFEFIITETYPDTYYLYQDNTLIETGSLTNDYLIVFVQIDIYTPGTVNYKLVVSDETGNTDDYTVPVEVTDFTPPYIRSPPNIVYSEGSTGNYLTWEILEANPSIYSIYRNNTLLESGSYDVGNVTISIDGLELGAYSYILTVNDEFGLSHSSSTVVTVVDITTPIIQHIADCGFAKGDPNAVITWQIYDLHPESIIIKLDGEKIRADEWTSSSHEISLTVTGWSEGIFIIEVQIFDTSGNVASDTVEISIVSEEITTETKKPASGYWIIEALILLSILVLIRKFKRKYI